MNKMSDGQRGSIRNVVIFSIVAIAAGWAGLGLGREMGQLLWIVAPLGTVLFLRTFAGDGWRDAGLHPEFRRRAGWYLFCLSLFPVTAAFTILFGLLTGLISITPFFSEQSGLLFYLVAIGFVPAFVKNIFEEFAWRGYLTPKLSLLGVPDLVSHALVGVVWAAWHIPYYLFFMDRVTFAAYNAHSLALFFPMLFAGVISLSFVYGEIRLLTRSVWPVLLLHTVSNAVGSPLLLHGFIRMTPVADLFVSPAPGSILSIMLNCSIGYGLYRFRKRIAH
jgi:membrane protease YdiL (CAAX protease family)